MKKTLVRVAAGLIVVALCALTAHFFQVQTNAAAPAPVSVSPSSESMALASPGRIEGRSEAVEVGAATDGVISAIHVREGQRVHKGDKIAALACNDLDTAGAVARAEADSLRQSRTRLMHGSRQEEREAAAQKTAAARAVLEQASSKLERMSKLQAAAAISLQAFEEARRDFEVAQADLKHAMRTEELVNAGPLREEIARADADIAAAEQRVRLAQDKLGKCVVTSPIDGTVLRVNLRAGESFALLAPRSIVTLADLSGRRVRAEVDERDVQNVRLSGKVMVTSDASGERRFEGKIIRVSPAMGKKSVLTGDPADKRDRDILEVVAELQNANDLPLGLRVTVQFAR